METQTTCRSGNAVLGAEAPGLTCIGHGNQQQAGMTLDRRAGAEQAAGLMRTLDFMLSMIHDPEKRDMLEKAHSRC